MSIFDFKDYRVYLKAYVKQRPRGELTQIASFLAVSTTLLSQILGRTRDLTPEQAFQLSGFLNHSDLETDYFSLLVQISRASHAALTKHLEKKREAIRAEALQLHQRVEYDREFSEEERSIYFSSSLYSSIHLFSSIKQNGVTCEEVMERFRISKAKALSILLFLREVGVLAENLGRYSMGVQSTFVGRDSPHLVKHHTNWRLKAAQRAEDLSDSELMFTGQISLSEKDFDQYREELVATIRRASEIAKDSPAEVLAAFNIDFFKF